MASELEAAIAALPAKKQRLRDSFDRLAAASPVPIPFTWADVDAHISSLQSSIAARFRLLQSRQAAALPATADTVRRHVRGKGQDSSEEEEDGGRAKRAPLDRNAGEVGGQASAEMPVESSRGLYGAVEEGEASPGLEPEEEEDGARDNRPPSDLNAGEEGEQGRAETAPEWSPDQDDAVEEGEQGRADMAPEWSPDQDDAVEEGEVSPGLEPEEEEEEDEEDAEETTTGAYPGHRHGETTPEPAGGAGEARRWDLAAARAVRDASVLADMLYWGNKRSLRARSQFLPALRCVAEPHALVVGAVRDFLDRTEPKSDKNWENCAALLCLVPNLAAEPSAATLDRAGRLAADWREMIVGKPEGRRDLGRLAVWGLLQFLVSYKITLELDARGTMHLLADVPRNKKQSCVELCNSLGMVQTVADSVNYLVESGQQRAAINYLIENGQQLDAIKLACDLNLTDRYPPLTLMNEYVEKAKKTALEILSREGDSPESLNEAMTEQVNALILSWKAVDEHVDMADRTGVKAEITQLLHGYAHKRLSLPGASSSSSSPAWSPQQQQPPPTPEWRRQQKERHGGQRPGEKQSRKRTREHDYHRNRKCITRAERWRSRFAELSPGGGAGGSFACDAGGIGDRRGQHFPEDQGGPSPCSGPC
ncbi:uncharacterized protein LOC123424665 [Hordeum vulgare subsp. vulgare]|uniref:FRIGIDA-like protein n=1 Tax=Hordeum vulgare subsp. vulgare TaxID=112509 RepID=A0A8I6WNK4_HORVV|nr:uncharacterized protein LOC123424665 [Hordeum vulgare subsp. vulgare]